MSNLPRNLIGLSLLLIISAFLVVLFYRGLAEPDEGRYAEIAEDMINSGNWLEMRLLMHRYYEKPPLTYWLVATAFHAFGLRDWAARAPLLINGILLTGLCWFLARRQWEKSAANIATVTMLSMVGFLASMALLMTDPFLAMWFALSCIALFAGCSPAVAPSTMLRAMAPWPTPGRLAELGQAGRPAGSVLKRFLLFSVAAFAAAMGFLTKGLVAIVLPPAIIFLWLLWERRLSVMRSWVGGWAILLGIGLLTPAMLLLEKHNPGFFHYFVITEHFSRFNGTRPTQIHKEPFVFFAMVLPLLLLPWTLFIVRAAWRLIAQRGWRQDTLSRFLLVWVVVVVLFFSASSGKLMSYILPAIPALGLLLGRWGLSDPQDSRSDRMLWNLGAAGLFLTALAIVGTWLFSYFRIRPLIIYPISGWSVFALIPITVMPVVLLARRSYRSFGGLLCLNAGIMLAAALMVSPLAGKDFNALLHRNSSQVYKELAIQLRSEDQVVVFWDYRPALGFYTQGEYIPFQVEDELLYGRQLEPERAKELQDKAQLEKLLQEAPGRVFAVIDPHDLEQKFRPLGLATAPADIAGDPRTLILKLLLPPIL